MRRAIFTFAVLAIIAVILSASPVFQSKFNYSAGVVNEYIASNPVTGAVVFVSFAALSSVLSPLSSVPTIPFAVLTWGKMLTFIFLFSGWTLGTVVSYTIGRYGLQAIFRRLLPVKKIEDYRQRISEHSEFILVVLFRLALPAEITGLVLGSLRYNFLKYIAAVVVSEIPFAVVAVYASDAFALNDPWQLTLWVVLGSAMFVAAAVLFAKRVRSTDK